MKPQAQNLNTQPAPHGGAEVLRRPASARRGFSFAEVMFAVIILGIGFIMIAAIFPVAIQQTQTSGEESAAAAIAREAAATIGNAPQIISPNPNIPASPPTGYPTTLKIFPPTVKNYVLGGAGTTPPPAVVVPFAGPRWDAIKDNIILPSDNRYAYVPFYRRENGASVAQLIVIAVEVRNRSVYSPSLDVSFPLPSTTTSVTTARGFPAGPAPTPAFTTIYPDTITVAGAAEGNIVTFPPGTAGLAGRSYRVGRFITATMYELEPADGLILSPGPDGLWGTNDDIFDPVGTNSGYLFPPTTLQPIVAYASVYSAAGSVAGRITLSQDITYPSGTNATNVPPTAAVTGAFVIVADDYPYNEASPTKATYPLPPPASGIIVGGHNGRIYRLGQPIAANATASPPIPPGTFDLDPVFGMQNVNDVIPLANKCPWARVYLVGAGYTDPTNIAAGRTGAAQDIAVYTTFFQVQ